MFTESRSRGSLYLKFADDDPPTVSREGDRLRVTVRDLLTAGEEVTIDYAMCDGSPYDEFDCACGSACCRGRVTGDDWRNPLLWKRYQGHFSPYLQRRIDALQREQAPRRDRRKRAALGVVHRASGSLA